MSIRRVMVVGWVFFAVLSPLVHAAGTVSNTRVSYLLTGASGTDALVYFAVTDAIGSKPSCNSSSRFIFKAASDAGEATLSLLQEAQAAGKTINVVGTGACDLDSSTETVSYVVVNS